MAHPLLEDPIVRKSFAKIPWILEVPDLIEIQRRSYAQFLQKDVDPDRRELVGMQRAFRSVFPVEDSGGTASLEFVRYQLGDPKYTPQECREKGMTYSAPMRVTFRLIIYDVEGDARTVRHAVEQEVYFGEIPLMTDQGTFIINGTERVVVNQLHRSPGVFFDHERGKPYSTEKASYSARIIPHRGSWLDFEFDTHGLLYVRIDRRRKLPVTLLLKALGCSREEILQYFYRTERLRRAPEGFLRPVGDHLLEARVAQDVVHPRTGQLLLSRGKRITRGTLRRLMEAGIEQVAVPPEDLVGSFLVRPVMEGEREIVPAWQELTPEQIRYLLEHGPEEVEMVVVDDPTIRDTLHLERATGQEQAMLEIYRKLRPTEPPTLEVVQAFFHNLFFNPERYDLTRVGRLKMNHRLGLNLPLEVTVLTKEDILRTVKVLIDLTNGRGEPDDIDHLGNRRVRTVGELAEDQFFVGLLRLERAIRERMSLQETDTLSPHELVNPKLATSALRDFFASSQLSQFMDQTNPLSEVAHKRRLSALGPGGLTRERAGFEVRDVHPTHYGRICPVETPEGPNIGLITSLSTYARVNEFGFLETPYRRVVDGKVTSEIRYLSALEEGDYVIAPADTPLDAEGRLQGEMIWARRGGEFVTVRPQEVDFIDVSPTQLVSVATSLIPFLEHDDANRALMGSNMQRQAVPLVRTEAPLVGTGMERVVARDSRAVVTARRSGVVESVDASRIVIRCQEDGQTGVDIYKLTKFQRSNQSTCINQRPLVVPGQQVRKGQVIADGPATAGGELALGRNVLVAFMPWGGYNFEDSVLVSERLVRDDLFTSIHIEEFEVMARETKLGMEEITRDIPNVGEEALKNLDECGIIRIGARVKPGDILVGKITPKGETQLSPEERLLRAIFGEKARDVQDTSLRVPPGIEGTVIDVKIFTRRGLEKDARARALDEEEIARLRRDRADEIRVLREELASSLRRLLLGRVAAARVVEGGKVVLKRGQTIDQEVLERLPLERWEDIRVGDEEVDRQVRELVAAFRRRVEAVDALFEEKIARLRRGDELPSGVLKVVKVSVAIKRKLSVGDKMAGRHGNKGVLSRVLPEEDMPYLEDGTPVEIVLNPLGVPSRMNVGQVLETHLGWAVKGLGRKIGQWLEQGMAVLRQRLKELYGSPQVNEFLDRASDEEVRSFARRLLGGVPVACPVFDGASEEEIRRLLEMADLPADGQAVLYDGRTGEPFDQKVTVGYIYMMKLHHLVDDKIHARSIGSYSLITQQPLGGKAQFGGQRLGEMEVWALEAYGAAHTLQEFLTVKSDDTRGRTRMYANIIRGEPVLEPGLPESFKVLTKELQALCLNLQLLREEDLEALGKTAEER